MVGRGVLRECLASEDVEAVMAIGRRAVEVSHPKLTNLVSGAIGNPPENLLAALDGFDAVFFCLGVSSSGMDEKAYRQATSELALGFARPLAARNPGLTFIYVSGAGTDPESRSMWARVKGETERDLIRLTFEAAYCLRPGVILPMHGERSSVGSYRIFYDLAGPLLRAVRRFAPSQLLTTETIGLAMLSLARTGWSQPILEGVAIYDVALGRSAACDVAARNDDRLEPQLRAGRG